MTGAGRPMVFGVPDLVAAVEIQLSLDRAGIAACVDVGQQGWPATVWIRSSTAGSHVSGEVVLDVVWTAVPGARRMRIHDIRRESVRVAAARVAAVGSSSSVGHGQASATTATGCASL